MVEYTYNFLNPPVNTNDILSRVSQEDIFKIFLKEEIALDKLKLYTAPYREDDTPGCWFEMYMDELVFVDFALFPYHNVNCFNFVKKVGNFETFMDALQFINVELKIGLGDSKAFSKPVINKLPSEHKVLNPKKRIISFSPREFKVTDANFWSQYCITKKNLVEDRVIPIKGYSSTTRTDKLFSVYPTDICYAYTSFKSGNIKIYRPFGDKKSKWFTNCTQNDIGGIENLSDNYDYILITKSYKDWRVLSNLSINSIWFQNEGMIPSFELLNSYFNAYTKIYIWFDNDSTGITASTYLRNILREKYPNKTIKGIVLPIPLLSEGIKDPSDFIKEKGLEELKSFISNLNL